jgi:PGF-pre-PGF domain-containing protein
MHGIKNLISKSYLSKVQREELKMNRRWIFKVFPVTVCAVFPCFIFLLFLCITPVTTVQTGDALELPDLTVTAIKPYHYSWLDEYNLAMGDPFFNLRNYVNVTVRNNGTTTAETVDVALYADGELIASDTIADLGAAQARELKFAWMPEGEDPLSWTDTAQGAKLSYTDTNRIYTLSAVVDEDEAVPELNETNNEFSREQEVVWNGFAADQPLEEYAHEVLHGGVIITTGDAVYRSDQCSDSGTIYGSPYEITYSLQIPWDTTLARLYLPYTWADPKGSRPKAPKIRLTVQTPGGTSTELRLDTSYNDLKGDFLNFRFHAWGTYAYDLPNYVRENGTYVVTVENINDGSDDDFTDEYSFAAPALLVVYEDNAALKREYWITEGADILMGGRELRADGGFLGLEECRNSAEFTGEHLDKEVESAVLGVISPWADDADDDLIEFNGRELGKGLYNGYFHAWRADLEGLSMAVGADEAQQGLVAIEVTRHLLPEDNEVVQGDDGDNMMPATAVLVVTYKEAEEEEGGGSGGSSAKDSTSATSTATSVAPAAAVTKVTRTIPLLEAGKEVAMIFQDMDVSLLALTADANVTDVKVVVERVEKPYGIADPSGIPSYVYLDLTVEHDDEDASIAGRIEFKVATSWIEKHQIDTDAVTLNIYHERDGWVALPTANVAKIENTTVFEAVTPDFSLFAVTADPVTTPASPPVPEATPVPTPVATLPAPTAAPATEHSTEPASTETPGFECVLVLLMLAGGAFLFRRRGR